MSEYGTGFAYCLGLFLAHAERVEHYKQLEKASAAECAKLPELGAVLDKLQPPGSLWPSIWFNGATDHLHGFQCELAPEAMIVRATAFTEKCLGWRLALKETCTWGDVEWAIQEAKDLLREYDAALGIPTEKGDYE